MTTGEPGVSGHSDRFSEHSAALSGQSDALVEQSDALPERNDPFVSVVAPVYNEAANLSEFHRRVRGVLEQLQVRYEILLVDDGSTDESARVARQLCSADPAVKLVSFSRNFGHQAAITAGMDYCRGDAVITMDSDLQHPPEMIPKLLEKWREGYDIVYTIREETEDAGPVKRATSRGFYWILRQLSPTPVPAGAADFRLLDRVVVEAFDGIRERTRFMRGLTGWVGFRSAGLPYRAARRSAGKSSYTLSRMFRLAMTGIVAFSTVPLHLAIYVGIAEALLGFVYGLWVLWSWLAGKHLQPGWASTILLLSIMGGIQLILMGLLGLYLGKVYEEVKHRPLYVVRRTIGFEARASTRRERTAPTPGQPEVQPENDRR